MTEEQYNEIKNKILMGMSIREACDQNESIKTLFIRMRKKKGDDFSIKVSKNKKASQAKKELTPEALDEVEKYFFGALSSEVKRGNVRVFRLLLDFLKARHPAYKETTRMFSPTDYKKMWEEINGKINAK